MNRLLLVCLQVILGFTELLAQPEIKKPPIISETLIFPQQDKHVHGSSIVSLPNGDFLATWFQGSGERTADDVRIMGARLKKGEYQWSFPFLMADTKNIPDCNPVLFLNSKGKLFLVWVAVEANRWEYSILRFRTSIDYLNAGAPVWNWQDNILLKPGDKFATETEKNFKNVQQFTRGDAETLKPKSDFFSKREKEVLELMAKGYASKAIAKKLFITEKTIESHRKNMVTKAKVKNTMELISFATGKGMIKI